MTFRYSSTAAWDHAIGWMDRRSQQDTICDRLYPVGVTINDHLKPVDPVNALFEDIGFGFARDPYCKSRHVVVAVKTLPCDWQLNF